MTYRLRLGIGTPTTLDALAQVHAGGRAARPVLERAATSAAISAWSPPLLPAAEWQLPGNCGCGRAIRCRPSRRLSDPPGDPGQAWRPVRGRNKYDGVRGQAHRTADGQIELFTRRLAGQHPVPDVVELLQAGLAPSEAIVEGELAAFSRVW
jgi:DNA ligase-1